MVSVGANPTDPRINSPLVANSYPLSGGNSTIRKEAKSDALILERTD